MKIPLNKFYNQATHLRQLGFSLLELLVVMVVIALLMGLVGPNFIGRLNQAEESAAISTFNAQLEQLPRWARIYGVSLKIDSLSESLELQKEEVLSLPPGWQVVFTPPLFIAPNQVCSSSNLVLLNDKKNVVNEKKVSAPTCELEDPNE